MILRRLRNETREAHARVERRLDLADGLDDELTLARYTGRLARLLGFYAPLEEQLGARSDWAALGVDFDQRRKAHLLRRDLAALGVGGAAIAATPQCHRLPATAAATQALGCLYVVEGATLGGQVLRRRIGPRLGLTADRGLAFFSNYGDAAAGMWRAFGEALERFSGDGSHDDAVVAAARATFDAFEAWLASPGDLDEAPP